MARTAPSRRPLLSRSDGVLVGAEIQPSAFRKTGMLFVIDPDDAARRAREIKGSGLGNFLAIRVPSLLAGCGEDGGNLMGKGNTIPVGSPIADYVALCHELGLRVLLIYGRYTRAALREFRTQWPGTVVGVEVGEILGHLGSPGKTDTTDLAEARAAAIGRLGGSAKAIKKLDAATPVISTDGTVLHHLSAEAGIDLNLTELFVGNSQVHLSAARGAARADSDRPFGSYLATGWYGGSNADPEKADRFRLGLYASYLHGASIILNESGTWGSYEFGDDSGEHAALPVEERQVLRQFYAFTRRDKRPAGGPETPVAFLQGDLDGWSGHTQATVWGSSAIECVPGDPERGWDLLDVAYPDFGGHDTTPASCEHAQWLSGAPYGPVDLLPARAPLDALGRYKGILCVGLNTMSRELWKRLASYVAAGGNVFLSAAQMSVETDRKRLVGPWPVDDLAFLSPRLYQKALGLKILGRKQETRGGAHYGRRAKQLRSVRALAEPLPKGKEYLIHYPIPVTALTLAGAQPTAVSDRGDPILLRHKHGKGEFWLFAGWCHPGHRGIRSFMRDVVASFLRRNTGPVQVESKLPIDWACYRASTGWKVYLLNTDLTRGGNVTLTTRKGSRSARLRRGGFRAIEM